MRRDFRPLAVLLTVSLAIGTAASAQGLRDADQPAEIPPSSFTGKQYVDSKGCVFVRAGFDGAVTWVPRVNRQRGLLCGAQPTFANQPAPVREPTIAPAPTVLAAATPRMMPRPAATARAPEQPRRVVQAPIYRSIKPAPVPHSPVVTPAQVYTPPPKVADASGCPYISSSSHSVRCGPQADHPGNYATGYDGTYSGIASTGVIRVKPAPAITPPPGYRAAFNDGRFNPNRGKQTHEGFVQMRLVWTSGTPRRLVDQTTGYDVTPLFPGLKWPFLTYKQQRDYVVINKPPAPHAAPHAGVTYATKNVVPTSVVVAPSHVVGNGHRFVQVGTFRDDGNVQTAVTRLRALGLPARTGRYQKNGATYRVVLAGPYADGGQLSAGLNAARRGGFPDAFTRK